jgi:neutral ceramidase
MIVGTSHVDITPQPGIELAGFAIRPQPSTEVLDPLAVRGLYLEDGQDRLLWLHADLIAFDRSFVEAVRQAVESQLGIPASRVLLVATHTHSGPATVSGNCLGSLDPNYMAWLRERFLLAARDCLANREPCRALSVEGRLELGVDRRRFASAHTDPRAGALALRRADGTYKAVILSYSMHPVCLRGSWLSADWPGETARLLSQALPGSPTVLVSSGACGNIDPPQVGVEPEQMQAWARLVAESVLQQLNAATAEGTTPECTSFRVASTTIPLPLEDWTPAQIHEHADRCLADSAGQREFREAFTAAAQAWRQSMIERVARREPPATPAELFAIVIGNTVFVSVNAEIFSRFTELVRLSQPGGADIPVCREKCDQVSDGSHRPIYTVGCSGGMIGYVPAAAAYDEGAYEVEWAMLFYNRPRPRCGGLELLAEEARELVNELADPVSV